MTSHAKCHHPKTKEARAACRQASRVFTSDEEWIENSRDSESDDRNWDPEDTAAFWLIQYKDPKIGWRTDTETADRDEALYALWNFVSKNPGRAVRIVEPTEPREDD